MRWWGKLLLLLIVLPTFSAQASDDSDEEDEGDSAPFVVAVEHSNGWRCGGSLVSVRSVLTTAWCALGPPPALLAPAAPSSEAPLWVLAGSRPRGAHAIRRVTAIAFAYEARAEESGANFNRERWSAWGGAENDIAMLELVSGFGSAARVHPILLAAAEKDCGASLCHAVQGAGKGVLVIEAVTRASAACAPLAPHWQAVRERALCFKGPEFCPSEWGTGVICGGKLCGVISRSARDIVKNESLSVHPPSDPGGAAGGGAGGAARGEGCGGVHAALSVPRWRKFFDCAHTLRECGRNKCAKICIERRQDDSRPEQSSTEIRQTIDEPRTHDRLDERKLDERRLEDRQDERRKEESQEESAENVILPAAARYEPASVNYEPRDPAPIMSQGYRGQDVTRYQQPQYGPQVIHHPPPHDAARNFERLDDLNVRPEGPKHDFHRGEYAQKDNIYAPKPEFPDHNFNYPRDDVVRGHDVRNWTSYQQYERTKPVTYERELSTGHGAYANLPTDDPVVGRGLEYDDGLQHYRPGAGVSPSQPSNMVGTIPPYRSSEQPNVYPPPFVQPASYAVPPMPQRSYTGVPGMPAIMMGDPMGHPPRTKPELTDYPVTAPPLLQAVSRQREFEPYRSDFKGGEYGDNAADYGELEPPPRNTEQKPPHTSGNQTSQARTTDAEKKPVVGIKMPDGRIRIPAGEVIMSDVGVMVSDVPLPPSGHYQFSVTPDDAFINQRPRSHPPAMEFRHTSRTARPTPHQFKRVTAVAVADKTCVSMYLLVVLSVLQYTVT